MEWLVLLHVMSAIIGVGPTYFSHVFYRKGQTVDELRQSMKLAGYLELFPKIGGTLALLSGIALVLVNDLSFGQFWIVASLSLYFLIQVVVVGFAVPRAKKLVASLQNLTLPGNAAVPAPTAAALGTLNGLMFLATGMGTILFALMVLRPVL